ncbi:MAG TPA: Holliday junction branch migration DNA helicase RuvB [Deltaproteobacteria bacterium]|nr:Holliday junction branch migration DNA helicase RuvB [Deltaproteobacteria bacterium]
MDRELSPEQEPDIDGFVEEISLRPATLSEYVGQGNVLDNLKIFIQAAQGRGEALDHTLFAGPPGLGKTTLAHVIAHEMGVQLKATSGPVIERGGDLAAIVSNLDEGDVLFIDEIHRLNRAVQEVLYPAMEDFEIDIVLGQGPTARSIRYDLPRFTLVGATTRESLLSPPFRSRFGWVAVLDFYTPEELSLIIARSADLLEVPISKTAALTLARRSRGTPRIANRLLRRVRDFAQVMGDGRIDEGTVDEALARLQVDSAGLDKMDRRILTILVERFSGGPVGIESLAAALGEERDTLEDVYEPYLVQQGYIVRSRQGRIASSQTYAHLGQSPPAGTTGSLF